MKKISIILTAVFLTAGTGYSAVVWSDDFESTSVGASPQGAITLNPTSTTAGGSYIQVVGSTPMGTGNGLGVRDFDSTSLELEYNFTPQATVHLSFTFSPLTAGSSSQYQILAMGEYNASASKQMTASGRRFTEARIYADGKFRVYWNALSAFTDVYANVGVANTFDWFVNDYDSQSVTYTMNSTEYVLPANSVAWWMNDTLILRGGTEAYGGLDVADATVGTGGTVGTTEGNLGRFGIAANTTTTFDYVLDDITIASIPEPTSISMVICGALALLAVRRSRT